jgi:hypothetical protein
MPGCWILDEIANAGLQKEGHTSFIGGKPLLPQGVSVPECKLCGAKQSFFFQVAFPDAHAWSGLTMSVFSCTSCADEDHLIPRMLNVPLHDADIPESFLTEYQDNFRFLVFESKLGKIKHDYAEKVKFKPLHLRLVDDPRAGGNKVGGMPNWILEDEAPRSYAAKYEMYFIMQLEAGSLFDILESAPSQMEIGLRGSPEPSPSRSYQLFNGNQIFMFGVRDHKNPLVYVLTQI